MCKFEKILKYWFFFIDSETRTQSAVMARMSDMLIHVFNTPSWRTTVMQNSE